MPDWGWAIVMTLALGAVFVGLWVSDANRVVNEALDEEDQWDW